MFLGAATLELDVLLLMLLVLDVLLLRLLLAVFELTLELIELALELTVLALRMLLELDGAASVDFLVSLLPQAVTAKQIALEMMSFFIRPSYRSLKTKTRP
jgi:hypothetical protein